MLTPVHPIHVMANSLTDSSQEPLVIDCVPGRRTWPESTQRVYVRSPAYCCARSDAERARISVVLSDSGRLGDGTTRHRPSRRPGQRWASEETIPRRDAEGNKHEP